MTQVEVKLHETTDATVWTDEFLRLYPDGTNDAGTLLGWFANAIEVGRTAGERDHPRNRDHDDEGNHV